MRSNQLSYPPKWGLLLSKDSLFRSKTEYSIDYEFGKFKPTSQNIVTVFKTSAASLFARQLSF